jgi:SAM-dependent methyltransferase
VIYQHPVHYLLGLEGVALLRAFAGGYDREFAEARVAEIRRLLDSPTLSAEGVLAAAVDTVAGYRIWSQTYDDPGNGLFPSEEAFVHDVVDALPAGVALDAACGTGRHAAYLADRGHQVIGVDNSPDMLIRARERVPAARFHEAVLDRLPLPDDHVDLAVCALALVHLPDLRPVFTELARVVRPGGHLIVTDVHHETVALGSVPRVRSYTGEPQLIPSYRHRTSDYLDAALPLGFAVKRCAEPRRKATGPTDAPMVKDMTIEAWDGWPWSLLALVPAATAAAWNDTPATMLWHFQLTDHTVPA